MPKTQQRPIKRPVSLSRPMPENRRIAGTLIQGVPSDIREDLLVERLNDLKARLHTRHLDWVSYSALEL